VRAIVQSPARDQLADIRLPPSGGNPIDPKPGLIPGFLIVVDDWLACGRKRKVSFVQIPTQRCYRRPLQPPSTLPPPPPPSSSPSVSSFVPFLTVCPSPGAITPQEFPQLPPLVTLQPYPVFAVHTLTPFISSQNYGFLRKAPCLNNRVTFKKESPPLVAKPSN